MRMTWALVVALTLLWAAKSAVAGDPLLTTEAARLLKGFQEAAKAMPPAPKADDRWVAAGRAGYLQIVPLAGPSIAVETVEDVAITNEDRPIPGRLYRDKGVGDVTRPN